ncbi:MAG: NUDIX hydrolase [Flavobacteriaceae bacterium]
MDFTYFSQQLSKIKDLPLPGESSHFKMMPEFRIEELKKVDLKKKDAKKAAVLALFYPDENQLAQLLLILRKTDQGVHSNQIAFPGGKVERVDYDLQATALREAHEEVGLPPERVEIIKGLTEVYIPPSNFVVKPFLGLSSAPISFVLQKTEVAAAVEVTLTNFMDDTKIFYQNLTTSYAENVEVPAFKFNGYTVWGATAMMLSEIKDLLKQVL